MYILDGSKAQACGKHGAHVRRRGVIPFQRRFKQIENGKLLTHHHAQGHGMWKVQASIAHDAKGTTRNLVIYTETQKSKSLLYNFY